MVQHISVRVPWHDHGWDGTVCQDPCGNTSCLKLQGIMELKDEDFEQSICGQCIEGYENDMPCLSEGATFMSSKQFVSIVTHPYKRYGYEEYQHFMPTEVVYPPYSLTGRPFNWLLKKNAERLNNLYNLGLDLEAENEWPRGQNWLQFGESHQAIFDYFYKDVIPNQSLCIVYAKQIPFIEEAGRVILGIGHIKGMTQDIEHKRNAENNCLRSLLWEKHIFHSIREDHQDGFLIPYEKVMEYVDKHPDFDIKSICVMAPSNAFDEFSYATEHVSYDSVIEVLLSCRKSFEIINDILDEDYSNVLDWIDARLNEVWDERGAFPGLGAMFNAMKIRYGVLIAKEITSRVEEDEDFWDVIDQMFISPGKYLSSSLAKSITILVKKTWRSIKKNRYDLFKLLSRLSLSIEQADVIWNIENRESEDIFVEDNEILDNPYLLYEKTRLKRESLIISVTQIDKAVYPVEYIRKKYPTEIPCMVHEEDDIRRVRALLVYVLENAALEGNTILPIGHVLDRFDKLPIQPECRITADNIDAIEEDIEEVIISRTDGNDKKYLKLARYNDFDKEIERKVKKKLKKARISIEANWRKILDEYLDSIGVVVKQEEREHEELIRKEKAESLKELAESSISILVGDAGTGKTTVLAALCSHQDIRDGGVLLLAPTGKATVRLLESMGGNKDEYTALNVAQFLSRNDRFDFDDMRYKLSKSATVKTFDTVIIDEASMLTEEMFGCLMQVVGASKRIIFVGDPNQLPPIGAGRPFVDLINLIKPEFGKSWPMVKNGYCKLTENCRQETSGSRLDVDFAKMFTDAEIDADRNIISEITQSQNSNIEFIRWDGKVDLEEKLFAVLKNEFNITDPTSFDKFFGGTDGNHDEKYMYFNSGISKRVDKWQILAPVKNMPQGVLNLNHWIHSKYRSEYLRLAQIKDKDGFKIKHIASPWGNESIVYGDKVINIRNMKKDSYPKGTGRGYIANGEIGIACGDYKTKRDLKDNSLRIEFSSQPDNYYFYDHKNFDTEKGTNDLELAYALTVHKSQGSQFGTVVLVLSKPCALMSKEMLYTALTRQKDKVIVLYNDDPHSLLEYINPKYSNIAKRFTDLFYGMEKYNKQKFIPKIVKVGEVFYENGLIHRTTRGELVRSKSEVIIADHLLSNGVDYLYEAEVEVDGRKFRPDFVVYDPDDDENVWYWEHVGMPNDKNYMERWEEKLAYYNAHGIEEGKNLIITMDGNDGGLDSKYIDDLIKETFDLT